MNQYVTGAVIKRLREGKNMTQQQLADKLSVSAKTISKWETAKGYPDITLLESIANALSVSVTELISGNTIVNSNVSANMLRSHFYVCPVCGNIVHSMGETVIQCHGLQLQQEEAEETDEHHKIFVEQVEDEYYVQIEHDMTKQHYISFIAAVSADRIQMVKLYPQGNAEARFKMNGVKKIYLYCNRSGMFYLDVVKGIDDRRKTQMLATAAGEQMKARYSYEEMDMLLRKYGFELIEHLDAEKMTDRYFKKYNEANSGYQMRSPNGIGYVYAVKG